MQRRRRVKQVTSFKDRLTSFAKEAREKAVRLPPGAEREAMLRRASRAEPPPISMIGSTRRDYSRPNKVASVERLLLFGCRLLADQRARLGTVSGVGASWCGALANDSASAG